MTQISQLTRFGLFDARVPRYTSYPTAPHFSSGVGPAQMTDWIGAIPVGAQISLYVHVPFCRRLCWFCACRTQGTQSEDPVRSYAATLAQEIALLKSSLPSGVTLSRLHWGGGTPTLLPVDAMAQLCENILDATPLAPDAEFSVEIDPNEIDEPRLDVLVAYGMNRASIGVQDFDPEIQKTIGREQSYEVTKRAVDMIRARNVASLNTDILYGLPHQTPSRIATSVQKLLCLSPDRVALYGYAHVPLLARRQQLIPENLLPSPRERLELFETAQALFTADGYGQIGIDHFARHTDSLAVAANTGRLRRNFQGYTDDRAPILIGIGASAISRFPQGYAQNAPATSAHVKKIQSNAFSVSRGHTFSPEDRLRGRMIEALMCDFKIGSAEILADFDITPKRLHDLFDQTAQTFGPMVKITPDGFYILEEGRHLTRVIARTFDAYDLAGSSHSTAV